MDISVVASPYARFDVSATLPDGTSVDPTSDPVYFAFLTPDGTPDSGTTWHVGAWDTSGAGYTARIQIGPGALVLASGEYSSWIKIVDNPETIVEPAGPLTIY